MSGKKWVGLLACCLLAASAAAQDTEGEVAARLIHKPLYLRGMWADDKLRFDAEGKPQDTYSTLPFTQAGIDVVVVKLRGGSLHIEGQSVGLVFVKDGTTRRELLPSARGKGISIDVRSTKDADFKRALDAIFVSDLADMVPAMPAFWQVYARKAWLAPRSAADAERVESERRKAQAERHGKVLQIGGDVSAPKTLQNPLPLYPEAARQLGYSADVQVHLWVMEDGSTSHFQIIKPAGMGLDEEAVKALHRYVFAPAMKDGKPVAVETNILIHFRMEDG